jgi:hypothetical protein
VQEEFVQKLAQENALELVQLVACQAGAAPFKQDVLLISEVLLEVVRVRRGLLHSDIRVF